MLASSGDPPPPPRVRQGGGRDVWRGRLVHQFGSSELPEPSIYPIGRRLLLVRVHLLFANDYSRPIRVRRASQVPQGRVPRGVHGKAR